MDVHVEQAVCALLLGEAEQALRVLRVLPGAQQLPNKEVAAFMAHYDTSSHYDRLLAACALGEQWVHAVVVPAVTWGAAGKVGEVAPRPFAFESWGSAPQVCTLALPALWQFSPASGLTRTDGIHCSPRGAQVPP
jgi:hypothetical protein